MEEQQDLKTDYQDYSFMGNKKFNLINNPDGTVSLEDVTDYETEGDDFGSNDINSTNQRINEIHAVGVYQGTCTDEELEQAIEDINKDTNNVLKDKNNKILDFIVPRYENDEGTGYIKLGNLKICWGIVNATYVNPNVMNADITFPITFENAPNVQLTLNGTNNVAEELDENAKVTNVTTTGAAVYVHSKNGEFSGGWQQNVNWLAIGY